MVKDLGLATDSSTSGGPSLPSPRLRVSASCSRSANARAPSPWRADRALENTWHAAPAFRSGTQAEEVNEEFLEWLGPNFNPDAKIDVEALSQQLADAWLDPALSAADDDEGSEGSEGSENNAEDDEELRQAIDDLYGLYDPSVGPDAKDWLELDEDARLMVIGRHVESTEPLGDEKRNKLHAIAHLIVENQVAAADPPEVLLEGDEIEKIPTGLEIDEQIEVA